MSRPSANPAISTSRCTIIIHASIPRGYSISTTAAAETKDSNAWERPTFWPGNEANNGIRGFDSAIAKGRKIAVGSQPCPIGSGDVHLHIRHRTHSRNLHHGRETPAAIVLSRQGNARSSPQLWNLPAQCHRRDPSFQPAERKMAFHRRHHLRHRPWPDLRRIRHVAAPGRPVLATRQPRRRRHRRRGAGADRVWINNPEVEAATFHYCNRASGGAVRFRIRIEEIAEMGGSEFWAEALRTGNERTGVKQERVVSEQKTGDVQRSYDVVAPEYVRRIYDELRHKPLDRNLLDQFATDVRGKGLTCDLGCGLGQVARFLHERGIEVCGVDLSGAMIEQGRRLNPDIEFHQHNMLAMDVPGDSWAGIAALYAIVDFP